MQPAVDALGATSGSGQDALLPLKTELLEVVTLSDKVRDKGQHMVRTADVVESDARDVREDAEDLLDRVGETEREARGRSNIILYYM